MSWKRSSEALTEIVLITTPDDVTTNRRLRQLVRPFSLDRIDDLSPVDLFRFTPRSRTSRDWEPFRFPESLKPGR